MSDAVELVGKLLDGFPNRAQAGRSYIGALASVLCTYPKTVAVQCCDLTNGVARETRFLPTVADLVAWCERETQSLRGVVEKEDHYDKLEREARERAEADAKQEADRKARPSYDDLKAKHGPNWGIGIGSEQQDAAAKATNIAHVERANRVLFQRECEAAGVDPNSMASPTLRALLNPPAAEAAE